MDKDKKDDKVTKIKAKKASNVVAFKKPNTPDWISIADDKSSVTIDLEYSLGDNGETIESITLVRAQLSDQIDAERAVGDEKSDSLFFVRLFSGLSGIDFDTLKTMDEIEDMPECIEGYNLLKNSNKTADQNIEKLANGKLKIKLNHPIPFVDENGDDIVFESFEMRRPNIGDGLTAEKASTLSFEQLAHKFSILCDAPVAVIKQIDQLDDFATMNEAFEFFRKTKRNRRKKRAAR